MDVVVVVEVVLLLDGAVAVVVVLVLVEDDEVERNRAVSVTGDERAEGEFVPSPPAGALALLAEGIVRISSCSEDRAASGLLL